MNLFVIFVLLAFYSYLLVQGKPFHNTQVETVKHDLEARNGLKSSEDIDAGLALRMITMIFISGLVVLLDVIMLCVGLLIANNLVVPLVMLTYFIVNFIVTYALVQRNKNTDYSNDYEIDKRLAKVKRKHTFYQKINVLIWMAYLVYLAVIIIT